MEKKLKIAEFAALIGVTAKTVYKMVDREEIKTVNEKVNNRLITLVVTNDAEIENFKNIYGKSPVNNGNYEDILTDSVESLNDNIHSQNSKNDISASEVLDRIIQINKEYNNELKRVNEELVNTKAQMLFLEDKASREGLYLQEIKELKTENEQLKTGNRREIEELRERNQKEIDGLKDINKKISYAFLTVIVVLLLFLVGYITFNIASAQKKADTTQEIVNPE